MASKKHSNKMLAKQSENAEDEDSNGERWAGHGIETCEGGFRCTLCDSGLMTGSLVVDRHIETAKHARRVTEPQCAEIPQELLDQGIVRGENNQYKCNLCNAQMASMIVITAHVGSAKHQRRVTESG